MGRIAAIVLALAGLVTPGAAGAIDVRYKLGLLSHYSWRGITLTDGPVLQPGIRLAHGNGASLGVLGNVDLAEDSETQGELDEVRLTLDYTWTPGNLEIGAGLIEYLFPGTPFPSTREVYVKLGYRGLVSPRLTIYRDFEAIDGTYVELSLEHGREVTRSWRLTVELSAGHAGAAFAIGDEQGFHDGNARVRLDRAGDRYSFGFLAAYTDSLDGEVLLDQPVGFWSGFSMGRRF